MQYKSGLNKIAMPQPWQAIAQRFCSIKICREATESVKLGFHKVKIMAREVKWTEYLVGIWTRSGQTCIGIYKNTPVR